MHDILASLVERALSGNPRPLEFYLRDNSHLPGARANLELANNLAHILATAIPRMPGKVSALLDQFTNGDRKMVESNTPEEFIMLCGIIGYGICAAAHSQWRQETFSLLQHYASSPYWRVREGVAMSYQNLIESDAPQALLHLYTMAREGNLLQQRAVVAAVAEPPLLAKSEERAQKALELQKIVLERMHEVPDAERRSEDYRILRRTLGFTLSVVTAALPGDGFALMQEAARWGDKDIFWILRENAKKKRLSKFHEEVTALLRLLEEISSVGDVARKD